MEIDVNVPRKQPPPDPLALPRPSPPSIASDDRRCCLRKNPTPGESGEVVSEVVAEMDYDGNVGRIHDR